eukprot:6196192-Pleurochrysis_carterae.AAC.1
MNVAAVVSQVREAAGLCRVLVFACSAGVGKTPASIASLLLPDSKAAAGQESTIEYVRHARQRDARHLLWNHLEITHKVKLISFAVGALLLSQSLRTDTLQRFDLSAAGATSSRLNQSCPCVDCEWICFNLHIEIDPLWQA